MRETTRIWRRLVLCVGLLNVAAFTAPHAAAQAPSPAPTAPGGIDVAGMDRTIASGDDFFRYANGTWDRTTPIPPDRSSWGLDATLAETAGLRTRTLLEEAAKSAPNGSDARKAADYYAAYMDESAIETHGLEPLQERLDRLAAIADRTQLAAALGDALRTDVDPLNATNMHTDRLFGLFIAQDFNEPTRNTAYLLQGGIGLPDREYYTARRRAHGRAQNPVQEAHRQRADAGERRRRRVEGGRASSRWK